MRVLIVDDHPLYRAGVRALLSGLDADAQVDDVANVTEALQLMQNQPPFDLILLDLNLPGVNRLEALKQMKAAFETSAVVVVSGEEEPALILSTIEAGAAGFIPKSTDPAITMQALKLVLAHGTYLPLHLLRHLESASVETNRAQPATLDLSERQRAVLLQMLQGKSNKVIARALGIAEGTVKAHLWSIYQLLGVNSRAQAMCKVHALGLLVDVRN